MSAPGSRLATPPLLAGTLLVASLARADGGTSPQPAGELGKAVDGFAASAESTTKAEIIKRELALLAQNARLGDPNTAEEAAKEIASAVNSLVMDARKTQAFFDRINKMNQGELSRLVKQKGNGVLAYGRAILAGEGGEIAAVKAALASGGDGASLDAVRLLRRLEEGRPVSPEEFKAVVGQLPPKKANSLIDAVRGEFSAGDPLKKQFYDSLGTMVDGVFVFNDAINIHYSDDPPEEKVAAAVGKGVEFGAGTVGGIAAAAVGGGFGAGIILGWSATQVGDLTKEMIGLYYDRQNAAMKDQWAKLELREMTIRKMLEVDRLVKAGKLDQALEQSAQLRKFYEEREDLIGDDVLGKRLDEVRDNLGKASQAQSALIHLGEARRPYERALESFRKRVNLTAARADAREARQILERWVSSCPELGESLRLTRQLETDIGKAIASATPVRIVAVEGPSRIAAGEWAAFCLSARGGIPWYCDTPGGHCGTSFAAVYWQAQGAPGKHTIRLSLRDDIGQVARTEATIEVLPGTADAASGTPPPQGSATSGSAICRRAQSCCLAWRDKNPVNIGGKNVYFACNYDRTPLANCQRYLDSGGCK